MALVQKELKNAYIGEYVPPYLCFTANTAWSTIALNKFWSPTAVTLETSTDWSSWSDYTFGATITLTNIWDKVYWRNKSETTTRFSLSTSDYYSFSFSWKVGASWDVNYLVNKNSTTALNWDFSYHRLFYNNSSLTKPPKLTATTLWWNDYNNMFAACTELEALPSLPATTLNTRSYSAMFYQCSKIKLSTTQTWEYQTPYRIPSEWTWTVWSNSLQNMFTSTWWTFTGAPTINTTYYTSNTVV
jgi:hypothetical protein